MPKYYEDIDEVKKKKRYACEGVRDDLLECLLKTDCCKVEKKTPKECMHDPTIPDECTRLRVAFFECKRSMEDVSTQTDTCFWSSQDGGKHGGLYLDLDMRTRFRGRKDY